MKANISILAWVLLLIGLVNAWVLHAGFEMLQEKRFSSSSSSPSPAVAALPGSRFIIMDGGQVSIFRMDAKGKITPESSATKDYQDGLFRSFEPFPTPIPTPTPYQPSR